MTSSGESSQKPEDPDVELIDESDYTDHAYEELFIPKNEVDGEGEGEEEEEEDDEEEDDDSTDLKSQVITPPVKKTRNKISYQDKIRIIEAYENGENMYLLGHLLKLSKFTVRNIVNRYNRNGTISTGPRGGYRKKIISGDWETQLLDYLDKNWDATLSDMQAYMKKLNLQVSRGTICRFLKERFITFKNVRLSVVDKNNERVKQLRFEYVKRILDEGWHGKDCIFVDEFSINLWMKRQKGWSPVGEKINASIPAKRGSNTNVIMAISKNGVVHYRVWRVAIVNNIYQEFITELSSKLPFTKHYIIQDNARFHHDIKTMYPEMHEIVYLPPYSPFLNPIESFFGQLKCYIRKTLTQRVDILDVSLPQRQAILDEVIQKEVTAIGHQGLKNYYHHVKKFYVRSLMKEDIHGD